MILYLESIESMDDNDLDEELIIFFLYLEKKQCFIYLIDTFWRIRPFIFMEETESVQKLKFSNP